MKRRLFIDIQILDEASQIVEKRSFGFRTETTAKGYKLQLDMFNILVTLVSGLYNFIKGQYESNNT